jgi:hypothetical protein
MSERSAARRSGTARAGSWFGSLAGRLRRAWRVLPPERRLAAYAAVGLFFTLFLPWYQETVIASGRATRLQSLSASLTGWGAFSFVEAAVLLVAVGVIVLLVQRAEGRAFHLPGGDGWVITGAGAWTCLLIIWRIFDKQGTGSHGQYATTSGIEWGIFVALAVAALLTYAGSRIRAAHQPEPPLPGEDGPDFGFNVRASRSRPATPAAEAATVPRRRRPTSASAPPQPGASPQRERPVGWLTARPGAASDQPRAAGRDQRPTARGDQRPTAWDDQRPTARSDQPLAGSGDQRPTTRGDRSRTGGDAPEWDGAPREWPLRRAKPSYPPLSPSPPAAPRPVRAADPDESEAPTRAVRPRNPDDDEQLTMPLDRDE